MRTLLIVGALIASVFPAMSQSNDKAQVISSAELHRQIDSLIPEAKEKGSSGSTIGDYGSHALKLSVRSKSGGAEVHAHFDDVILVTGGTAELITGGSVIDPKTGNDGETKGTGIRDGKTQSISAGDIVHIPAGTPHQMKVPEGTIFSAFVVKVKE